MSKIRVLLADDHAVLRAGLKALLNAESDLEVVGEAGDGVEAVERTAALRPDVVVMDIGMPRLNGLEATRQIHALGLPTRVLVLTMHAEEQYLLPVLRAGAAGYVLKRSADTELLEAIRSVHRGDAFLDPTAARMLVQAYQGGAEEGEPAAELTQREREVLKLTAAGYTNQEIAEQLVISSKTVDTYRARVMEKLKLRHRSELVRYALKHGLLEPK
ncbi:MAG: response regulator transcription factor [Chloroflexi bacterium]|nr:response regulator transcription factor [Chloroflexota bacterium]